MAINFINSRCTRAVYWRWFTRICNSFLLFSARYFCGLEGLFAVGNLGFIDDIENEASKLGLDVQPRKYTDQDLYTEFCNDVYKQFQSSIVLDNAWSFLKPVVVGKLFYTPVSPATTKIIEQMNKTFEDISVAFDALGEIAGAQDDIFKQLYDYFQDPVANDLPLLTILVDLAPVIFDFSELNETSNDFFSNNPSNKDMTTWQDLFNATFEYLHYIDNLTDCFSVDRFQGFESEAEMEDMAANLIDNNNVWAGFVFKGLNKNSKEMPSHLNYKIRMKKGTVDDTERLMKKVWLPNPRVSPLSDMKPLTTGQVFLTDMLEKAFVELHADKSYQKTGTWVKQFPTPCYKQDNFVSAISGTMPLFMTLAWLFSVGMIVKGIVYEKETRLKEVMKVMGLGNSIHWIAWFITSFVILFSTSIVLAFILKFGTVLSYSNVWVVLFVLFSYVIPTITFCFLISVFFSKANIASAVAGIVFFLWYLPYTFYRTWQDDITSNAPKFMLCLFSNVAFGFACTYLAYFEQQGTGVQWHNINDSPVFQDDFSIGYVILMMYVDALIYLLLALYIEQVFPGEYGVAKKWYFPFQKSFWKSETVLSRSDVNFDPNFQTKGKNFENEPSEMNIGVQVRNLVKVYSTGNKLAVDDLSINFYKDQITSFLGHNGAGKTTTLSILTGLFQPTSGTAFVNGLDIRDNIDVVRRGVGMCPQYNVLFDKLTVSEHLQFYGRLRGKSFEEIEKIGIKLLLDLNLPHKAKDLSSTLSGGMKRKLSVAISFIGDNKTVILDEPTAGVDPHSRRGIWELLTKYKKDRTIILSTHHMDEADILGDRIAIIASGKLQCIGSSLYLRRKFGKGYQLTVTRLPEYQTCTDTKQDDYDPGIDGPYDEAMQSAKSQFERGSEQKMTKFFKSFFPEAELSKNIGTELTYTLPYAGLETGVFTKLFHQLDLKKSDLGIADYGLSDTPLEDIFIHVAEKAPEPSVNGSQLPRQRSVRNPLMSMSRKLKIGSQTPGNRHDEENGTVYDNSIGCSDINSESDMDSSNGQVVFRDSKRSSAVDFASQNVPKVTGLALKCLQFKALYLKRVHHIRKDYKAFFSQILLPAGFIFLAMVVTLIVPELGDQKPLELHPYLYGDDHFIFFSDSSDDNQVMKDLMNQMSTQPHHSTRCMQGYSIKGHSCEPNSYQENFSDDEKVPDGVDTTCDCSSGFQKCDKYAKGGVPARKTLATTEILEDLTGRDISDYILKTRFDYKLRRFYGFEFEGERNDYDLNENEFVQATFDVEEIIDENNFFSYNYSSGFQWKTVFDDINFLLNDSIAQRNIKVWWNNKAYHMLLASTNSLNNLILRHTLPDSTEQKERYGITAISHPWKMTVTQLSRDLWYRSGRDLVVGICVIFAMSFVPASFVLYLISERTSKSKHLQYVSGVNPTIFWVSTFLWDMTNYLIPAVICVIIFLCFQAESYVSGENFPCLCLILFLYGFSITPLMYPTSYIFSIPSTAYVLLTGINAFIGINCTTATYILDFFPEEEGLTNVNKILKKVFLMFPQYCLGRGLFDMALNQLTADALSEFGEYKFKNPMQFDIAGKHILAMFLQGIAFFILLLIFEHVYVFRRLIVNFYRNIIEKQTTENSQHADEEGTDGVEEIESDVKEEKIAVLRGDFDSDPVVVKNLKKQYSSRKKFVAVNNLSFHVPKGECFGLLGVNGAGKTSTFNMLTGDSVPSGGKAILGGFDVVTHLNDSRKKLGFCPQFDALDPLLTVKEHILLYARLRGINSQDAAGVTEGAIVKMGLAKYRDKQAGTLSGGNKRKLSTAIALVGNPQIIFLDEPTSGMDPKARRYDYQKWLGFKACEGLKKHTFVFLKKNEVVTNRK